MPRYMRDDFEPYTIEQDGITYEIEPVYNAIVDSYGPGGSVEQSHRESAGYSNISGYSGIGSSLNFLFAKSHDEIDMTVGPEIKSITINFSNLYNTNFYGSHQIIFDAILNCKPREAVKALRYFLENNSKIIGSMVFKGIDNAHLEKAISKICNKYIKNYSFTKQSERIVEDSKNIEKEVDKLILDVQTQLMQEKEIIEDIKARVNNEDLDEIKQTKEELKQIDTEKYQKRIEDLQKQIPKKIREQYKFLSPEEIMLKYGEKIKFLFDTLDSINNEKQLLEAQLDVLAKEKLIDDVNEKFDNAIDSTDRISNEIADFWTLAHDTENSKIGIIKTEITDSDSFDGPPMSIIKTEERCASLLEFELSKRFGKPISSEVLEKRGVSPTRDCIITESTFLDETKDDLSLKQKNEINKRKTKIEGLKMRAKKHPAQYNKPGTITLYSQIKNDNGLVTERTEFEIGITQGELISMGLDPSDFGWKEIERPKVNSNDIAKASKEKGVKKSLIGRIARIFTKEKKDRDK